MPQRPFRFRLGLSSYYIGFKFLLSYIFWMYSINVLILIFFFLRVAGSTTPVHDGLTEYVICPAPSRTRCSGSCYFIQLHSIIPYTFRPSFIPLTKSIHFSLSMHITFASLSSSDLTLHAFLKKFEEVLPPTLHRSTYDSYIILVNHIHSYAPRVRKTSKISDPLNHNFLTPAWCDL